MVSNGPPNGLSFCHFMLHCLVIVPLFIFSLWSLRMFREDSKHFGIFIGVFVFIFAFMFHCLNCFHIWPLPGIIFGSPACPNLPDTLSRDSPDPAELVQCRQIGLPRQAFDGKSPSAWHSEGKSWQCYGPGFPRSPKPGISKACSGNVTDLGFPTLPKPARPPTVSQPRASQDAPNLAYQMHFLAMI